MNTTLITTLTSARCDIFFNLIISLFYLINLSLLSFNSWVSYLSLINVSKRFHILSFIKRERMGGCLSCKSSKPTSKNIIKNIIRVVHLNGYIEDFEDHVTVSQVTGKTPKHFLCTQAQLLSPSSKQLKPDASLELGRLYFLLPYSILGSDVSLVDLASLAKKLTAMAKTSRYEPKSTRPDVTSVSSFGSSSWSSPAQSPNQSSFESENCDMSSFGMRKSTKSRSWKPLLATIREKSFNRRSESELQEKHLETLK